MTKAVEKEMLDRMDKLEKLVGEIVKDKEVVKLDKLTYSVAEVARMLSRTPQAVYLMIERGELEAIKLGHVKITATSLKKVLGHDI